MLRGSVHQWWHYIPQTCVVLTDFSVREMATRLLPYIDQSTDYYVVTEIKPNEFEGWLPQQVWDWLLKASESVTNQKSLPPL